MARVRANLRRSWATLVGLTVLVGLAGGAVLGGMGIARRTDGAFEAMAERTDTFDVLVNPNAESYTEARYQQIAAMPQVTRAGLVIGVAMTPASSVDVAEQNDDFSGALVYLNGSGWDADRPTIRDGRMPDPQRWDEVYLESGYADRRGIKVGDRLGFRVLELGLGKEFVDTLPPESTDEQKQEAFRARHIGFDTGTLGTPVDLVVTGIGVTPTSVVIDEGFAPPGTIVTPAFWERFHHPDAGFWGTLAHLRNGADDTAAFREAVQPLFGGNRGVVFQTRSATAAQVARAVEPPVFGLHAYALIIAAVAIMLVGQAIVRRVWLNTADNATLAALGFSRRQRTWTAALPLVLVGVAGATLATILAVALSPLGPTAPVRATVPNPDLLFDAPLLAVGFSAITGIVGVIALVPSWFAATRGTPSGQRQPAVLARLARRTGLPVPAVVGIRFATQPGHGRAAAPVRSTLTGAVTAVAVAVATLIIGASLAHLLSTPRLFGSDWQVVLRATGEGSPDDVGRVEDALTNAPTVTGYRVLSAAEVALDGRAVPALAAGSTTKQLPMTLVEGREPAAPDEIALGATTLRDLDRRVGDTVTATGAPGQPPVLTRIVGQVVLPGIGTYSGSDKTTLGSGALFTSDGLATLTPDAQTGYIVINVRAGTTPEGVQGELNRAVADPAREFMLIATPTSRPSDIVSLAALQNTPGQLTALLVLLLAGTVGNALFVAVRRRQLDLAIVRTLGGTRRQLLATGLWQASTIALIGLALGLPLGLLIGRTVWTMTARYLGTIPETAMDLPALIATASAVLVIALTLGLLAGFRATRTPTTSALRVE